MMWTKMKAGAAALAAATATVVAAPALLAQQGRPDTNPGALAAPPPVAAPAPRPAPADTNPDRMVAEIARAAIAAMEESEKGQPRNADGAVLGWHRALAEAEFRLAATPADRVQAVRGYLKAVEKDASARLADLRRSLTGLGADSSRDPANFTNLTRLVASINGQVAEARSWLAKVEAEATAAPKPAAAPEGEAALGGSGFPEGGGGASPPPARFKIKVKTMPADEQRQQRILEKLELPLSMNFENDCPLADVIHYIQSATEDEAAGLPTGIPIYVDPQGLHDVDKTMASTIGIKLEGIPLRTSLTLLLRQLDLAYVVEGGLLRITDIDEVAPSPPSPPATAGGFR